MFNAIRELLKGYKTYISMTIAILTAILGWTNEAITLGEFIMAILTAIGLMTVHATVERGIKGESK